MKIEKIFYVVVFSLRICVFALIVLYAETVKAQSTNQNFPTPITAYEISGQIQARDIGDARLTNYFYVFNAAQGDVFINVVTKNLNGDIDVFTAENLRPLAKITLYADATESETGRVIYLRQPAKLILRIEGRTPNDAPATYRIKFAGSFAPAVVAENSEIESPTVKSDNQTDIRVNSVGTIIEIKPKPTPKPKEVVAETKAEKETKNQTVISENKKDAIDTEKQSEETTETTSTKDKPIENQAVTETTTVVAKDIPAKENTETENQAKKDSSEETEKDAVEPVTDKIAAETKTIVKTESKVRPRPKTIKAVPAAALAGIRLVILLKDGTQIESPMSEVLKFGIDKGVLTVILKNGTISRYSLLDVEKTTIE